MKEEDEVKEEDWWSYEAPRNAYDLVGNNFFTNLLRPYIYIAIRFYYKYHHKLRVLGYKSEYSKSPYIVVSNHSSHLDTALIFSCFPFNRVNRIRAVAALDYFFSNPLIRVFTHLLANTIPINRKAADFSAISMCKRVLSEGGNIIIYPEGTRTRTGKMGEFKPGIGLLVKKTRATVLPVFIKGTFKCYNFKKKFPSDGLVEIAFGSPFKVAERILKKMSNSEIAERLQMAVIDASRKLE